jgi:excinuclease ABC subunit C
VAGSRRLSESLTENPKLPQLRKHVSAFPKLPGVYIMKNDAGEVIYVGKAKELRSRVLTYFDRGDGRAQIEFLMRRVIEVDRIVTESEHQAFVLERDLIQKHKPRYNVRLKDDKAFLSIRIGNDAWPRLELVRRVQDDGARYFGPYAFSYELRELLETIKRAVPLRSCADTVFHNRQRPCLEYQIKRCLGPCCLPVDRGEYQTLVKQAIRILEGHTKDLERELAEMMDRASAELRFEDAAAIRDRLVVLTRIGSDKSLISHRGEMRDVWAFYREGRFAVVCLLMVRNGRVVEHKNYTFEEVVVSDEELLSSVIGQAYVGERDIPEQIFVSRALDSQSLLEDELIRRAGGKVEIHLPQRGLGLRLVQLAEVNARQHFSLTFEADANYEKTAEELALLCKLQQIPRRIECVDISNFQGSDIVAAVISFFDGKPDKSSYRRFKIQKQGKPDDFASIYEVTRRRFVGGMQRGDLPDLLVVDGGQQQLAKAEEARVETGAPVELISLAKMRVVGYQGEDVKHSQERIFTVGSDVPHLLPDGERLTRLMQQIRDEAHRFAITFHRERRGKRVFASELDGIKGISGEMRTRLLKNFGSTAQIAKSPAAEIARVGRMPLRLAMKIVTVLTNGAQSLDQRDE